MPPDTSTSVILDQPTGGTDDRRRPAPIHCEFCECKISIRGRLIAKSDRARAILALDDEADQLRHEVERLKAELARVTVAPAPSVPAAVTRRAYNVGEEEV